MLIMLFRLQRAARSAPLHKRHPVQFSPPQWLVLNT
jgi:hypothetical protein